MAKFTVTIIKVEANPQGGVSHNGYFGKVATFRIDGALDKSYRYSGNGMGKAFEANCARMQQGGPIFLEADYPESREPDTEWKERVVNLALVRQPSDNVQVVSQSNLD